MADVAPGSFQGFENLSSAFVAVLLGYSLIANQLELLLALLILVAVFYAKPTATKKPEGYEGEFTI